MPEVDDEQQTIDAFDRMDTEFMSEEFAAELNRIQREDPDDDYYVEVDKHKADRILLQMKRGAAPLETPVEKEVVNRGVEWIKTR